MSTVWALWKQIPGLLFSATWVGHSEGNDLGLLWGNSRCEHLGKAPALSIQLCNSPTLGLASPLWMTSSGGDFIYMYSENVGTQSQQSQVDDQSYTPPPHPVPLISSEAHMDYHQYSESLMGIWGWSLSKSSYFVPTGQSHEPCFLFQEGASVWRQGKNSK